MTSPKVRRLSMASTHRNVVFTVSNCATCGPPSHFPLRPPPTRRTSAELFTRTGTGCKAGTAFSKPFSESTRMRSENHTESLPHRISRLAGRAINEVPLGRDICQLPTSTPLAPRRRSNERLANKRLSEPKESSFETFIPKFFSCWCSNAAKACAAFSCQRRFRLASLDLESARFCTRTAIRTPAKYHNSREKLGIVLESPVARLAIGKFTVIK